MDGAQEVTCGFVVARGNGAVLLEPGKEVLDQVTGLVQLMVVPVCGAPRNSLGRVRKV